MKKSVIYLSLYLSLFLLFASCDKKENPATTGNLLVRVKLAGSTGLLTDVIVGVATSQDNLDNGTYLKEVDADAKGDVLFKDLLPNTYYYDCDAVVAGQSYYGEGQIQIVAGKTTEVVLEVK